jgi:hypothetical protein
MLLHLGAPAGSGPAQCGETAAGEAHHGGWP